jgi:DNA-binding transcriptional regulator YhcF (GntR family)
MSTISIQNLALVLDVSTDSIDKVYTLLKSANQFGIVQVDEDQKQFTKIQAQAITCIINPNHLMQLLKREPVHSFLDSD